MGRLEGLDALRGIAALIVVGLHIVSVYGLETAIFSRAHLAVDFFFMLSGYVMARTYERDGKLKLPALSFVKKRYFRLWPPMVFGAVLASAVLIVDGTPLRLLPLMIPPLFLMLPNLFTWSRGVGAFPGNPPAWSITAELFANLVHAVLLARLSTRAVAVVGLVALAATQLIAPGLDTRADAMFTQIPLRTLASYSIGIVLWRSSPAWGLSPWFGILALPGSLFALSLASTAYAELAFIALCPLILLSGLTRDVTRIGPFLGALSFPLYAVHYPTLLLARETGVGPIFAFAIVIVSGLSALLLTDRERARRLFQARRRADQAGLSAIV